MFNKIFLAGMIAIAGMLIGGESQAQAQNCYRGGGGYSSFSPVYSPVRSVSSFNRGGFYGSPYRGGFNSFGPSFGYSSFNRGGSFNSFGRSGFNSYGRGRGRGGVSIGFGF